MRQVVRIALFVVAGGEDSAVEADGEDRTVRWLVGATTAIALGYTIPYQTTQPPGGYTSHSPRLLLYMDPR